MADLVEKLQLQVDKRLLQFEPTGLKELCSFTSVQEPGYEVKTKRQLVKLINRKVNTLIEKGDKFELLNNIIGKSEKEVEGSAAAINNGRSKYPPDIEDRAQSTFHSIDIDAELIIIRERQSDINRTKQSWS